MNAYTTSQTDQGIKGEGAGAHFTHRPTAKVNSSQLGPFRLKTETTIINGQRPQLLNDCGTWGYARHAWVRVIAKSPYCPSIDSNFHPRRRWQSVRALPTINYRLGCEGSSEKVNPRCTWWLERDQGRPRRLPVMDRNGGQNNWPCQNQPVGHQTP